MTPYFSIILSSYNVDKYIVRCVESFLSQSYTNYELIIVDDGSTDSTGEIAECYAQKYSFIKCVHKENGGLSSARNAGLGVAKGKFIHFCDADDWVSRDFLETIAKKIVEYGEETDNLDLPDIIKFNYYRHIDGEMTLCKCSLSDKAYSSPEKIDLLMTQALREREAYILSAWSHIYKIEFLIENGLEFVSERKVGSEDFLFNLEALSYAKKVCVIDEACYYYDLRQGSLTQKYRKCLPEQYIALYREFMVFAAKNKISSKHIEEFEDMVLWYLIFGTCFVNEYRNAGTHTISDGRRRVKEICGIKEVRNIVDYQLKGEANFKKRIFLLGFRYKIEVLFYYLFVVRTNKRRKR